MSFFLPGILLAVFSGLLNGLFTLPMKFLGRWNWENVWAVFIVVSCLLMPAGLVLATVSKPWLCLQQAPTHAVIIALLSGFAWGFGALMFGQGVSALGISLGNTLVLAISASLGSFLPILILSPATLVRDQGKAIMLGTTVGIVGVALCGYAGMRRERANAGTKSQRKMVGEARPFGIGFLLCAGSGLLSAVFNIGYSSAQAIATSARQLGNSAFAGSNLIWLLMLGAGTVANLGFCAYLLGRNRSWPKFLQPDRARLGSLSVVMGVLWGASIFVYGLAAPKLGQLGPAIGWPLSLIAGLLVANLCGVLTGEWKTSRRADRRWMVAGLMALLLAIGTLGWSSTLG
jgi:L-rhamnose-H+ transport protein